MDVDPDPDVGGEDPDLSLNYKVVGSRRVQRDEKRKRPGDYWQADSAWGVWPPDADHPTSAPDEERAKAIADGADLEGGDEDADGSDDEPSDEPSDEDQEESRQERLDQVRKQFRDTLKTDLGGEDHPSVKALLDLPNKDFDLAMREFGDRVNFVAKQVAKKNFGWVANEADRAVGKWRGTPTPQQLASTVAAVAVIDSLVSDPERLAGVPLQGDLSDKALAGSARASFNIYRQARKDQRQKALARSALLLHEMGEDDPRRTHLEARIDGLALACYLEGEDPVAYVSVPDPSKPKPKLKKSPKDDPNKLPKEDVESLFPFLEPGSADDGEDPDLSFLQHKTGKEVRLRPEMSPSFGKLVRVMAKAGRAEALLVPSDDFFGPKGRSAISHALQEAENDDLADLVKDGPFEDVGDLLRDDERGPRLGAGQKAVLRDAVRRIVLEDATTVQAVLNATTNKSQNEKRRVHSKDLRARAAQKARRDEKVRTATRDLLHHLRGNPPDEEAVEGAVSSLILAGMKSLDEVLQQLFDSGEVDPLPLDDPHLAKVRHAIKTGDLSVLWKKVVDPDSIRPLSGPPAQEDSSMSEAKRPAPPTHTKKATHSPLVIRERRKLAAQLDQCVLALQQNQADLGIAPGAVQAFTQVADKVADHLDGGQSAAVPAAAPAVAAGQSAPAATAQARQAAQRRQAADWDPENIGREVSGPLEDLTPNDSTFNGEFTMQENRELGDDYEAGKLDPNKTTPEPRAARPGIQASMESLKSLEAQVRTLRKSLQAGILSPSEDQSVQITRAAALASSALRKQVQVRGK